MYEYRKLRGKIVEVYGSQIDFAHAIGRTPVYVSNKLTGLSAFNQRSIELWANALDIPVTDYGIYFFE